jgi:hypothetical protein
MATASASPGLDLDIRPPGNIRDGRGVWLDAIESQRHIYGQGQGSDALISSAQWLYMPYVQRLRGQTTSGARPASISISGHLERFGPAIWLDAIKS